MNLNKKCLSCWEFFSAEPMEFKFFCDKKECQEKAIFKLIRIKKSRHIPTSYFDIYDLDRPIKHNSKITNYERVCRVCGEPLLRKKDGTYSYHMRYCKEHNGSELWAKYNWGKISKNYAKEISKKNKEIINQKFKERIKNSHSVNRNYYQEKPERIKRDLNYLIVCEECGKLCQIYSITYLYREFKLKTINIHHKSPVHTLNWDNLHLIWDKSNLIALCEDCHNRQDHHLKTKVDPYIKFKKITEFLS